MSTANKPLRRITGIPLEQWTSEKETIAELEELVTLWRKTAHFYKDKFQEAEKELSQAAAELERLKSANIGLLTALGFENKTGQHKTPKEGQNANRG